MSILVINVIFSQIKIPWVRLNKQKKYFLVCQLRECGSNDSPIAMSTPSTEIVVSNIILQKKKPWIDGQL